jgi:hypothetical protein
MRLQQPLTSIRSILESVLFGDRQPAPALSAKAAGLTAHNRMKSGKAHIADSAKL